MKNIKSKMIFLLTLLVVILLGYITISQIQLINIESKAVVTSQIVEERIQGISQLSTLEYKYKDVIQLRDHKEFNGVKIPFSEKSLIVVFKGEVKAGIELEQVDIYDDGEGNIKVVVPKASILSHNVDEKSMDIIDEQDGLFNDLEFNDLLDVISNKKEEIEAELLSDGFLSEADKRTEIVIKSLFNELELNQLEIKFK